MNNFPTYTVYFIAKIALLLVLPVVWTANGGAVTAKDAETIMTVLGLTVFLGLPFGIAADFLSRNAA